MRTLQLTLCACLLGLAAGCGDGLCEGTGGIIDECLEGFSQQECEEWDDMSVNGADWTFHATGTCEGRGYPNECNGAWLPSHESCP